jgi:3'-5' exoribonuclease-like protein
MLDRRTGPIPTEADRTSQQAESVVDAYFSADVETDGPIPGPYSILSFAIVYAGSFDGKHFIRPRKYEKAFYKELKPISNDFQEEALRINGLDRARLCIEGSLPQDAMTEACRWVKSNSGNAKPVLVAYPLSFDWAWLYWYFIKFSADGSPFGYSRCFDIKTAHAVKATIPISAAGRSRLDPLLLPIQKHTHHALDDAIAQAEIFANVFEWEGVGGHTL